MRVGIHTDLHGEVSNDVAKYEKILDYNGIENFRMDINDLDFWSKIKELDLFIFRWRHIDDHRQLAHSILPIIERNLGINCFPNWNTYWHFDDKIKQYYLLEQSGFPIIKSWIFWDKQEAIKWAKDAEYPIVFKLKGGASSENVLLVPGKEKAIRLIRKMFEPGIYSRRIPDSGSTRRKFFSIYNQLREWKHFFLKKINKEDITPYWQINKNYILFQEFMPDNSYDTRVTVIGNRAFAFRRFNRDNDFRSSGSGKLDFNTEKIDLRFISKAFEISKAMNFQSMAYDFLYNKEKQPVFCEISYTFIDTAIRKCAGYWDSNLIWHEGHFWPQYCQLSDLLKLPDLIQPQFEDKQ
jgi:glutathione synthase/RimK-type ligase-like ATP-grasp enzyme